MANDSPNPPPAPTLKERLEENERLLAETGHYAGVDELRLRRQGALKYEALHAKLRAVCVSAREMARRISASPGVREVGESVVALYTPEGDAVALSNGIMVHVHTASRFLKWMIRNDYEGDPGFRPGDIFANNDAFIGTVQVPDVIDATPIFHDGELLGWICAVCHELEVGGITPGGDVALAQERHTEGLFVCAEKVGENDRLRRDYLVRCERCLRMPVYWILDEKAKVAACQNARDAVLEIVREVGADYYKRAVREFIEEGRRAQLARARQLTVPGRYRGAAFYGHVTKGKPGLQPLGPPDLLCGGPLELTVAADGKLKLDFDGAQGWGWHSMNCSPAGMDGGMFVTLTQHMNYEGLVNDGAWLATELNLPRGSWTNPDNEKCATATSWALLLPAFGCFQRLLSRAFLARGFREEVFVGQVNSPMIEMGGQSQYGGRFGMAHFECAAGGGGALAVRDGLDTAYVGWNPESDMGNAEVWEQSMPMLYLGRSITPDSGGPGKRRGGCGFTSTWMVHNTAELSLVTSEHSARILDNGGMCGGYPAPTSQLHIVARNTDIAARAAAGLPLPHALGTDPARSDPEKLLTADFERVEGPHIAAPLREGDVFCHSYNGGGGYGDPLERDPHATARDVENGHVTETACRTVFGVELRPEPGPNGERRADPEKTAARRETIRRRRIAAAVPVSEWTADQRARILRGDLAPEIRRMLREAARRSERFAAEFREFWKLPEDYQHDGE